MCALVLTAALVACGGGDTGGTEKDTGGPTDPTTDASGDDVSNDTTTTPPTDSTEPTTTDSTTPSETSDPTDVSPDADAEEEVTTTTDAADDDGDVATEVTDPDGDATTDPEVTTDATAPTDVDEPDSDVVVPPCSTLPREAGCDCDGDTECDSGFCAIGPTGSTCVATCDGPGDCTGGSQCVTSAGGDGGVCLEPHDFLCLPCDTDAECRAAGGTGRCLSFGAGGSFCGTTCGGDDQCPDSFYCLQGQCVPDSGSCDCTDVALELGASTTCRFTNAFGVCTGQRTCGIGGLTACDARTPARDICDGIDQDCDNILDDDPTSCDDQNACTDDICGGTNGCQHPPKTGTPCNDNNECTQTDLCQPNGTCAGTSSCICEVDADCDDEPLPAGLDSECVTRECDDDGKCQFPVRTGSCSDDNACTTGDTCNAGACAGTATDCDDDNPCTNDSCNASGVCVNTPRTGSCEDGDPCTTNDMCNGNTCEGQALDCSSLDTECHIGVCDGAGGCQSQALTCGVTASRQHVPAAAFSRKGTGATWLEGSAGHRGPIGKSSNNIHTIHFGIHPGNR